MELSLLAQLLFYFMVETSHSSFSLLVLFALLRLPFVDSVPTNFGACSFMVPLARVPESYFKNLCFISGPLPAAFCCGSCSLNGLDRLVDQFLLVTLLLVFCTVYWLLRANPS